MLKELEELSTHCYVSAYSHAIIHLALGDKNRTFEYLEKACNDGSRFVVSLLGFHRHELVGFDDVGG
jgi:hypothetical protein